MVNINTLQAIKTTNKALLTNDPKIVGAKKDMTKNILTIVNDRDLSEVQMKREIRAVICDKIVDGTNLTSKDRIDIVECGWICYRLNRDAGRSRVVSHILAVTVIIDAIGFMLFGQRNKLRDLTNLIYATATRPVGYAIWTFGRKTISYFLPALIAFLGWSCGAPFLINLGKGLGDAWKTIKFDSTFFDSLMNAAGGLGATTGANLPLALAGVGLITVSNTLRNLFAAIYAVYISIFNSLKRRDPNGKVDRKEINQKSVMGLESTVHTKTYRCKKLTEGTSSLLGTAGMYVVQIIAYTCVSAVMQLILKKVMPTLQQTEGYNRYSESIALTTALLFVGRFFKGLLIDTPLAIGNATISFAGFFIVPVILFVIKKILWPYIKGLLSSFFDMLPGLIEALSRFFGNIIADIDEYVCKLLQKAINSRSTKELEKEATALKLNIKKMANSDQFKGKGKNIDSIIKKVDSQSTKVVSKSQA